MEHIEETDIISQWHFFQKDIISRGVFLPTSTEKKIIFIDP